MNVRCEGEAEMQPLRKYMRLEALPSRYCAATLPVSKRTNEFKAYCKPK